MTDLHNPRQNHLLDALPATEYDRLFPNLELVALSSGDVLYESGDKLNFAYFPTTGRVSLLYLMENGASSEIAVVGNEGMIGVSLFMGGETTPNQAVVLSAGYAYRLREQLFMQEFDRAGGRRSGALQHLLLRYTQALLNQMAQTAVCNQHHSIEQRLCYWLLISFDRISGNELIMTHGLMATMLGVRREVITKAAGKLQRAGLIQYSRGHITLVDRPKLEALACECYQVVKKEFNRLLPEIKVTNY